MLGFGHRNSAQNLNNEQFIVASVKQSASKGPFYAPGMEFGGIYFLSCLSVCVYVCGKKTLTLVITFEP